MLYKKESITKSMLPEPRGGMDKTKTVPLLAHARAVAWIKQKNFRARPARSKLHRMGSAWRADQRDTAAQARIIDDLG